MRVKFIPVKHGDEISLGDLGLLQISGKHKYLGFQANPKKPREGWLVVAVNGREPWKPRVTAR